MRKLMLGIAAAALAVPALTAPAFAQKDDGYEREDAEAPYDNEDEDSAVEALEAEEDQSGDDDAAAAVPPPEDDADTYRGETWQGRDGRTYCRRSDGTTGLIVGGGAGALVGRGIDTRGERGTGTIIGAIAGAVVGRAIERGASCR